LRQNRTFTENGVTITELALDPFLPHQAMLIEFPVLVAIAAEPVRRLALFSEL
jgi:hypothetical protein